ncbi:MAG TPA: DUF1579 domain-containing protein [Planctomycetota bacterium]|nr:DUF1579 domain-containing protein [Planctomycetota bacterium]
MKARMAAASMAILAVGGLALAAGLRQETYTPPKPTKFHEYLKQFEGNWDSTAEFMGEKPGDPPMKSKGSGTDKLIAGGLFLVTDYKGNMMGTEFVGHGIMGYDTVKKKYTGCWIDSMSTAIWTMEGTADDAGKVFTSVMEGPDPMSGKPMKMKMVSEITGKDSKKLTMSMEGPDGKEMSVGKIEYTRKK